MDAELKSLKIDRSKRRAPAAVVATRWIVAGGDSAGVGCGGWS